MKGAVRSSSTVSGAAYTYLANGHPPGANWTGLFRPGERVRLRFINGSSMSIFDVRIPNLKMTVVQTDGNDVEPVTVDEFRISVAETYDVILRPTAAAYTVFAQVEDRTGYARATLAQRAGLTAPVPPMDPRPLRTMVDMAMPMAMKHSGKALEAGPSAAGSASESPTAEMEPTQMPREHPGHHAHAHGASMEPAAAIQPRMIPKPTQLSRGP
jgi:FtsP/CotA-like multicopper oxidase with cupredoxin domain